ncbi:MAG: hypothetical protein ACYC2H_08660 [Thermoplasmatota archaeon]
MTTTLTNPTSSRQLGHARPVLPSKESDARPPILVILTVCAVLVTASAFTWTMLGNGSKGSDLPDAGQSDGPDAVSFDGNAASQLASLSALEPVAAEAGREATQAVQDAQLAAASSMDAAVAEALLAIEEALAASSLPALPEGYVPGMALDVHVSASDGYTLPRMPVVPAADGLSLVGLNGDPSPVGSGSGETLPLGDLLAQLEGIQATLEGLVGDLPLEGLPVGGVGGLPVGGPSPAQGAEGAVTPDEEGAQLADLHADSLLTATSGVYGQAEASLTDLLAAYESLAAQVDEAIANTRAIEDRASTDIQETLEARLAAIERQAVGLEAQANQVAATHARAVAKAQAQATAALDMTLRQQVSVVEATSSGATEELEARVLAVQADVEARKAEIAAVVDQAAIELSKPGAPIDAVQRFDAIQAAAATAVSKIDRDAKAEIAVLEEAAAKLDSDSRAAVDALEAAAAQARVQINGTVADSLEQGLEVKSYLLAVARAQAELAAEREAKLAATALAQLEVVADDHVEDLVDSGLKSAAAANSILADTLDFVGQVEDLAVGEVGKDLEYIQKVSEDYSKVPTEDRRERAGHWSTTASAIEDVLGDTLATGQTLEGLAARTVRAAQEAQAEITGMA